MASGADALVEQWGHEVLDFSSQYGSDLHISYVVPNIEGQANIYPKYGDFTQACVLRTYGPWWQLAPSAPARLRRRPPTFISEDFIDILFETRVFMKKVEIFETYNPGAVVRLLACNLDKVNSRKSSAQNLQDVPSPDPPLQVRWHVLWTGSPESAPASCRVFSPEIHPPPFPTRLLRIELNHSECEYYTELDAVRMTGTPTPCLSSSVDADQEGNTSDALPRLSPTILAPPGSGDAPLAPKADPPSPCPSPEVSRLTRDLAVLRVSGGLCAALEQSHNGWFDYLPEEVVQVIVSYLDLPSLCRLAQTSSLFFKHCYDSLQQVDLDLQPYWTKANDQTLESFIGRGQHLQHLNLSWCGGYGTITSPGFNSFLQVCSRELTCLRLACCRFVDNTAVKSIAEFCPNLLELDLQCCKKVDGRGYITLTRLEKLQNLNLYRSMVDVYALIAVIRACPDLRYLNIGSCVGVNNWDDVALEIGSNCKELRAVDCWRARSLTEVGLHSIITSCPLLEELDVGWCNELRSNTGVFRDLVEFCPNLKKLYLTANRTVCDLDVKAFTKYGTKLEQLDMLGTTGVSQMEVFNMLESCRNLRFLDLSFCTDIDFAIVHEWKEKFPRVSIKKSYQAV